MSHSPIDLVIPMRLTNPLNNRQHWRVVSKRGHQQKKIVLLHLKGSMPPAEPIRVTLTRVGKRKMDTDGLAASFKHVRDAIAMWMWVDDGDEKWVRWEYRQEIGKDYFIIIQTTAIGAESATTVTTSDPAPTPAAAERRDCVPVAQEKPKLPPRKSRPVKKSIWGSRA